MSLGTWSRLASTVSRLLRFPTIGLVVLALLACAPDAEPIQGDLASALETGIAGGRATFDHGTWDELLGSYAKDEGRKFDYAGLKQEESKLDTYLKALAEADLSSLSKDELIALFINAYNAYTVKTILQKVSTDGSYRIKSIRDIPDVFDREDHQVGGFPLSLNNMEHNILRPYFKDPRVHFAVNCASTSCPPIPVRAFTGSSVEEQLDDGARRVLSDPDYVRAEDDRLRVTKIMDWYGSDFVTPDYRGAEKNLPAYIEKYTSDETKKWIQSHTSAPKVKFLSYDWALNRAN